MASTHLAVALDLRRRGILDHFVCMDESLCSIAIEEGLSTLNLVVLGRNNPSLYAVNGRPVYVHLNGLAIVLLK